MPCQRHPLTRGDRQAAPREGSRRYRRPAPNESAEGTADQRATTLSAGDFSALAGVTDERTKIKELLRHPRVMPSAVVLDPAITLHTPEWLWLSTGIRAVDHCVEGVCSNEAHVFGDAQALKGLALLASGLPRVKAEPKDLAARLDCQLGAWLSMGPLSSGVPMGASHGIGYPLRGRIRCARFWSLPVRTSAASWSATFGPGMKPLD